MIKTKNSRAKIDFTRHTKINIAKDNKGTLLMKTPEGIVLV